MLKKWQRGPIMTVVWAFALVAPALAEPDQAAGADIYAANCAICHGDELRNPGSSFDLKALKNTERARFDTSVMEGKGQMPPWRGTLDASDMEALWAYIRANSDE
jgi:mono/diheme cytochrome c family protein